MKIWRYPKQSRRLLCLKVSNFTQMLSADQYTVAQPVAVEKEKEETPVDARKDKAKGGVNLVILSKERVDLNDDGIEEKRPKLPERKPKKLSRITVAKLQQTVGLKASSNIVYPSIGVLDANIRRIEEKEKDLLVFFNIVPHTDSTIALAWLNTPANRLKTFVANRVAKVQELTEGFQWNHVLSVLNPADLVSRGLRPCDLPNLRLWWHGPQFLEKGKLSSEETSLSPVKECEYSKELKTGSSSDIITSSVCVSTNCASSILSTLLRKSNSYMKIVRIFSYVLRFSNNVNKRKLTLSGPLSATDIDQAETKLIRMVQEQVFLVEIKSLQSKGVVSPNSKLRN
ncbi:integrase catalytic domain-containing protein [Trichonephila clavipes]|nr:integrase catalytic domain-containing protein [Trichonephila clavipes]